jgi:hypothetical protein
MQSAYHQLSDKDCYGTSELKSIPLFLDFYNYFYYITVSNLLHSVRSLMAPLDLFNLFIYDSTSRYYNLSSYNEF